MQVNKKKKKKEKKKAINRSKISKKLPSCISVFTSMYSSVTRMHRDKEILKFCDVSVTLTKTPRAPDVG